MRIVVGSLCGAIAFGALFAACSTADEDGDPAASALFDESEPTPPTPTTEPAGRTPVVYFHRSSTLDGVEISLNFGRCNSNPEFSVEESADEVSITVISDDQSGPGDWPACADGVTFTLDEFIGDRPLINAVTGRRIRVNVDFGLLSVTDVPVASDEILFGQIVDRGFGPCVALFPIENGVIDREYSSAIHLVWPSGTTWSQQGNGGAVVVGPDGTSMVIRNDDIVALRGSSTVDGPSRSDQITADASDCPTSERWYVGELLAPPGIAAFEALDLTVADAVSTLFWPGTIGPDGDIPPDEPRLVPQVPTTCELGTLPFQVGGHWWTTIIDRMIDPADAEGDWFGTDEYFDEDLDDDTPGVINGLPSSWEVGPGVPIDLRVHRSSTDTLIVSPWPASASGAEFRPALGPAPTCVAVS